MLFPASFKLALMCCSCLHHLLPWVASSRFVMHHARLRIMPGCASCHVYVLCVYLVVCFFPVVLLLISSYFVAIVRTRSSTLGSSSWLNFLHGHVLLPSRISGKMTVTLDLTTIIAILVASFYRYAALPIHLFFKPPNFAMSASNLFTLPSKPLFVYVTALLNPSYSVVSCRWSWRLLHGGQVYVGIS